MVCLILNSAVEVCFYAKMLILIAFSKIILHRFGDGIIFCKASKIDRFDIMREKYALL